MTEMIIMRITNHLVNDGQPASGGPAGHVEAVIGDVAGVVGACEVFDAAVLRPKMKTACKP